MNSTRNTEWLLLSTTVGLVGLIAHAPVVSMSAAIAAVLAIGRPWSRAFAYPLVPVGHDSAHELSESLSGLVFRGLRRGDTSSKSSAAPDGPTKSEGEGTKGSRSYREFAANLPEAEDEEISFMPHYASDVVDPRNAPEAASEAGVADSLLTDDLKQVEQLVSKLPVPRRFALGTVAIIRRLLEPQQVEQILLEQRRYPRLRFGDVAIQLNLLTEVEVQELLVAQEEGIFSDEEISDARRRLASYHGGAGT